MHRVGRVVRLVFVPLLVALGTMALVVLAQLDAFTRAESCMPQVEILDVGGHTGLSISPSCLATVPDPVPLIALGISVALTTAGLVDLAGRKVRGHKHLSRTTAVP